VAQWPYLLPESLTVSAAASPTGTLAAVLVAVALAAVIVLPGFALLYVLDQKGLLPEEGIDDASDQPLDRSPVDHIRPPTDR
jgi:cytochrome d ubiquinol oxidase subunit II